MNKIQLIFGVFLLAFCLQARALAQGQDVIVKEITGLVQVRKASESEWTKGQDNDVLTSGDSVRSFLKSSALLVFPDGSEFRLRENTSLDIKDVSENPQNKTAKRELKLNLGSLHYKVPPKKDKASEFKIHSSTSIVGITGTEGVVSSKGDGKPSENILIEGATYNTDEQGGQGRYQTSGNIYLNDGEAPSIFSAEVEQEAGERMGLNEDYVQMVNEAVARYKKKKSEGYKVDIAEIVIKQAFFYLEKRNYELVRQMVSRAETLLENTKKTVVPVQVDQKIQAILAEIRSKEDEGYDTYALYTGFANIQALKQNGYFKQVNQEITTLQQKLAQLTDMKDSMSFEEHFRAVQLKVIEKEKQGFALGEIKSVLRQARVFYDQDDKPKACQLMNSAEKRLSLVLKNASQVLLKSMDRLEEEISLKKTENYPTKALELRLEEARVFIKEEDFLRARELVAEIEAGLLTLTKEIPVEWKLKINEIKSEITYKKTMGYDVNKMYGDLGTLEEYQEQGDLAGLEALYAQMKEALAKLKLPSGFDKNWKAFLVKRKIKKEAGFDMREVDSLVEKIALAVEKEDITSARSFLKKAEELLTALRDEEPPKVQILAVEEQSGLVTLEGYASDNTKVDSVSVNNTVIELSEDGKFTFKTVPTQSLKELSVRARDIRGNASAPVIVPLGGEYKAEALEGKLAGLNIVYSEKAFTVKGTFVAGGRIKVGDLETFCDSRGDFAVMIDPRRLKDASSITVQGFNNGVPVEEVLTFEDKWAPSISITKLTFNDNFVPVLDTVPLAYQEKNITVSGQVGLKQMVNIEGKVTDIGGGTASIALAGREVDIRENGAFSASMVINPSDQAPSVSLKAVDKAGNTEEKNIALDVVWRFPVVKINSEKVFLGSSGKFTKDIVVKKETNDATITLENSKGEAVLVKRLRVADVWPPELEIQDVRYEGKKVTVTGRTSADATVEDVQKSVFPAAVQAKENVAFTLTADYPDGDQEVILAATNIEGKVSDEVKLTIGPPQDRKAPVLYVSSPGFGKNKTVIKGFVEDDSSVKSLTVAGAAVDVSEYGLFSHELESKDLASVEVIATDTFGNQAKEVIAVRDKEPPQITINTWEANNGRLIISGEANDNVAVKEVRVNNIPVARGHDTALAFRYDGVLTEHSKEAVVVAVDLLNNQTKEGPRALEIPTDATAPRGKSMDMHYGSPIIYASGQVDDLNGIKAVYVNGEQVELFDNGSYSVKVAIDVAPPNVRFEAPAYDSGKVILDGKAVLGTFDPVKIVVESEDLSGNRGVIFSQEVKPYGLADLEVVVNGVVVEIGEDGAIHYEQPMVLGQRILPVEAADPFDNTSTQEVELESNVPFVELDSLEYDAGDESVLLTGRASDEDSGLNSVAVNGVRVDLNTADGSFSYKGTFEQQSLNVLVIDNIGNVASSTKQVKPPDIWPPVFALNVTPVPSIIGNSVYIEITSLDSRTRLPEILGAAPTVTADLNGRPLPLDVQGEGVNYIATLDTAGLDPVLVTIAVEGADTAGNRSVEIEGTDAFALVAEDTINPSFSFELAPSPMVLGEESTVKVFASEDLKEPPVLTVTLPSGTVSHPELTDAGSGEYGTVLTVPVEEGLGNVVLRLSGGEDLSGNIHDTTEETFEVVAPVAVTDLPLNIHSIEFLPGLFTISGQTASEAVVQMEVGEFLQDIFANTEGLFTFERQVLISELEDLHRRAPNILVSLKAHNYAGFESPRQTFEVPLPPIPEQGGEHFTIQLQPSPVGQGDLLNINVEVLQRTATPPRGLLYLPDGTRVLVDLAGQGTLNGQTMIPEDAPLGTAVFEVVAGDIREGFDFDIVLSTEWMQRLNKDEFYHIYASPDPLIVGTEASFVIETMGDLTDIPSMQILLPDGQTAAVPLQGSLRRFQGRYQSQANMPPGRAELVLNPGTPEEVRRPYGIEEPRSMGGAMDIFLLANPNPLFGGEPYDVSVSLSRDINFIPKLVLKLRDGRRIDIPMSGSLPSSRFEAQGTLPPDVGTGLARFVLLDDRGLVMDRFPANVSAPITSTAGLDIFVVPDLIRRLNTATVQLNSLSPLPGGVVAHVNYPDGSKVVVALTGDGTVKQGQFTVPDYVPEGVVTITLFDSNNTTLGSARAQVVEQDHGGDELIHIFLDNPDFRPSQTVRMGVESDWPLDFVPRASLMWDGGSRNISLNGRVPGNRFRGQFTAPAQPVVNGRIEVQDPQGAVIGRFDLQRGPEGDGDVIITPMPPVIGEPLSIRVVAPSIVNTAPTLRLYFEGRGPVELNAYGALPGDTFTASLNRLENPVTRVEVIHEGRVVADIPMEHLTMRQLEFFVEPVGELVPCQMTELSVRTDSFIPYLPQVSVDFQGLVVEVSLSQLSSTEFLGRLPIPCDVSLNNVNVRVFNPQGGLLWQRMFSQTDQNQGLFLNVMPVGQRDVQLEWQLLRGITAHEIRYGKTSAMGQRIVNQGANDRYYLTNLDSGLVYFFQIAALKDGREIMASDIMQATVGAITRELQVYEYINGTNVHLVWDEYPGATGYRVGWGNAPGAFPNTFNLTGTDYFVPGLAVGNTYYMKVFALDGGQVIGESREVFVPLQAFQSQGGDIYTTPSPPVEGQNLQINIHSFNDLPFVPNIVVHLQNGDVSLVPTGFARDYTALMTAAQFTSPINAIDVFDPNGNHMFGRPFSGGGEPGGSVNIIVTPDPPQIGVSLQVRAEFPGPVPYVPRLFVETASQTRQYTFPQPPNRSFYEAFIPVADMTSSVIRIWVERPNGQFLGDRFFATGGTSGGPGYQPLFVSPGCPAVGSSANIELSLGGTVSQFPKLRIHYTDGMLEVAMTGTLPGNFFTFQTPILTSMIMSIDVLDPVTLAVESMWWPDCGGGPGYNPLFVNPVPLIMGQPVNFELNTGETVNVHPVLRIHFIDSVQEFDMLGTLPGDFFTYTLPSLTSPISFIDVVNPATQAIEHTWFPPDEGPQSCNIYVSNDPPVVGLALDVQVSFPQPLSFSPKMFVDFQNGPRDYFFPQGPGLSFYSREVPIGDMTSTINRIEIQDQYGAFMCDYVPQTSGVQVTSFYIVPDPPQINQSLQLHVEFNAPVGFIPRWEIDTINGPVSGAFSQGPGFSVYDYTVPSSLMTVYPITINIMDDNDNDIPGGHLDIVSPENFTCTVEFNPYPPVPYTSLTVTATYQAGSFPSYVPTASMGFVGGGGYNQQFPQPAGVGVYQMTIPGGVLTGDIAIFGVGDASSGGIDCGEDFEGGDNGVDLDIDPDPPVVGSPLTVSAYFDHNVPFEPRLVLEYYGAPDKVFIFPGGPGNTTYQYNVPIGDMQFPIERISVETPEGEFIPEDLVFPPPAALDYPHNLFTQTTGVSGEIKIFWDVVSGASGYKIYYGNGSQNYNESGSPIDITDGNVTQAVVNGLNDNTLYFLTVEAYDAQNNESNNPEEVSAYPGTGGGALVSAPAVINASANPGNNISQQSLTITNNGTTAANVRVQKAPLSRVGGGGMIPGGNYTIAPAGTVSIGASGGNQNYTVDLFIPGGANTGDYDGVITFFDDVDSDAILDTGEAFVDVDVNITVGSPTPVDHIRIEADMNSSQMGSPIFVTLTAEDSGNNKVDTFEDDVTVTVSEVTPGEIVGSWHLSTNDGPKGPANSTVSMFGGLGALTVDALEPETLHLVVSSHATVGGPLNLEFLPASGSTIANFAIIAPSNAPTSTALGAPVWIAAIDGSGQVATGYTGPVDFSLPSSSALFVGNNMNSLTHTFAVADNGQFTVVIKDATAETVTLMVDEQSPGVISNSAMIDFVGVTQYLAFGPNKSGSNFAEQGTTMKFTLRAADSGGNIVRSYNEAATFTRLSDPTSDAYLSDGNAVQFTDGIAEIILNNNQVETVTFDVKENTTPAITTGTLTANFQSSDATAPQIVSVEMDTPWIVHIYFDEDIDSATGGDENNYNVGGGFGSTIDKVCWYGDNVTLNLSSIPGTLGSTFNLVVNGVKDTSNNTMSNVNYNNIAIPNVDFQGAAGPTNDWFEIQASNTNPSAGETILITVYHKNVCGYLTGNNQQNANSSGLGSVTINYTGAGPRLDGGQPSSVDLSSGVATFEVTVKASPASGSVTIWATGGSPTVNTTQNLILSIP